MDPHNGPILREPIFPLANPGLVSIPFGFLGAVIGTLLDRPAQGAEEHYERVLFQALTGIKPPQSKQ
ncbi:cation acetate symporter, partial [Bacillus sp. SIMBA_161]